MLTLTCGLGDILNRGETERFGENGRQFASDVGRFAFPRNVIKSIPISIKSSHCSYKSICEKVDSDSFFLSDITKPNFHSLVSSEKEFGDVLARNKHSAFFFAYKYIYGKRISLTIHQESGVISSSCIEKIENKLNKLVIGAMHREIISIIKMTARLFEDEYFIMNCDFKIKFIITTEYKIYVYKLFLLDTSKHN